MDSPLWTILQTRDEDSSDADILTSKIMVFPHGQEGRVSNLNGTSFMDNP